MDSLAPPADEDKRAIKPRKAKPEPKVQEEEEEQKHEEKEEKPKGSAKRKAFKVVKKEPEPESEEEEKPKQKRVKSEPSGGDDDDDKKTKKKKKEAAKEEEETPAEEKKAKKPHRWRPGTVALREIKRYQKSDKILSQRAPLERQVRDIADDYSMLEKGVRFTKGAISALHEARDSYATDILALSYLASLHAHRVTLMDTDLNLTLHVRGDKNKQMIFRDEKA